MFEYNEKWFSIRLLNENGSLSNKKTQNAFRKDARKEATLKKGNKKDDYLRVFLKEGLLFERLIEFRLEEKQENLNIEIRKKEEYFKSLQSKYEDLIKKHKELKSLSFLRKNKKNYWNSYIKKYEDVLKKYLEKNKKESYSNLNRIKEQITLYKKEWEKLESNIKQKEEQIKESELLHEKIENSINDLKRNLKTLDTDKKFDSSPK